MAIKIRGKYTNSIINPQWKKGLYDFSETIIKINADGTIGSTDNLFLGYEGEDHVRVINFDTRDLNWGVQRGDLRKSDKELSYYYSPRVLFFNPNESRRNYKRNEDGTILVVDGKFHVETNDGKSEPGLPNPFMIKADENYFYIPNEVTSIITKSPYEIVYALIEKQNEPADIASGNIPDCNCTIEDCSCFNNEVFVSEIFKGFTTESGKKLFDQHKSQEDWKYYSYTCNGGSTPGLNNDAYLHKNPLECKLNCGMLETPENQTLPLGHQGDVYITPLKIYIPVPRGVWAEDAENKKAVTKIEVIFANGDESYLIQPDIREIEIEANNNLSLICWVPKEVTKEATKSANWKIALHLWTEAYPLFEIYSTAVEGKVEYTFIEDSELVTEEDRLDPLYQIDGTTLVIAGEDWLDSKDPEEEKGKDFDMWVEEEENGVVNLGRHQI